MQPAGSDVWLGGFLLALGAASVATWVFLWQRRLAGPLLPFEPRRPVPWGAGAAVLITLFVLSHVFGVLTNGEPPDFDDPAEMVRRIAEGTFLHAALFGSFFAAVVLMSQATQRDIGLPEFADQFARDVRLGIVGWLAALAPVYGLQGLLQAAAEEQTVHPLIQALLDQPNAAMIALAFLAAVVVAPICEELAFRLLLQGWLEKWLDGRETSGPLTATDESTNEANDEARISNDEWSDSFHSSFDIRPTSSLRGWVAILLSSLVFALGHLGHGPDPIPLFLLALILGYLYQRTHRVVAPIVTHLLFNLTTLVMLWLAIRNGVAEVP